MGNMTERDFAATDRGTVTRRPTAARPPAWLAPAAVVVGTTQLVLFQLGAGRLAAWILTVAGVAWLCTTAIGRMLPALARLGGRRTEQRRFAGEPTTVELGERADRELWRVRASVSDEPGGLAALAGQLALLDGDIRTMQVHPVADAAVDEFLLHLPGEVGHAELVETVISAGGRDVTAERTGPRELDDVPTRALRLATELVEGTDEPRGALRALLGDVEVRWLASTEGLGMGTDELLGQSICLDHPGGGVLLLRRRAGEFTPAEFARARAMTGLAASRKAHAGRPTEGHTARDGSEFAVRGTEDSDLPLVRELHERCSNASRHRRYFVAGIPTDRRPELSPTPARVNSRLGDTRLGDSRLGDSRLGSSLLATSPDGEVVAMGDLDHDGTTGELALLVRDDWQGLGVGSALRDALLARAREFGLARVSALTQLDNTAMARTLRSAGFKHVGADEPGEWSWTLELRDGTERTRATSREASATVPAGRTLAETSPH
ncbi:Acetyltransferase (GNAT) family protein [Actinopolyspora alba]|uniref:Acetyltransferase (GNAT) family protein n=2 Tax=Actinopolyspora alba TaxID=673379 RepID=A0A1I2BPI8_9ACTN|nr:Acetyltransferase (GNAT) family protein [Actinopolyspora alba]